MWYQFITEYILHGELSFLVITCYVCDVTNPLLLGNTHKQIYMIYITYNIMIKTWSAKKHLVF